MCDFSISFPFVSEEVSLRVSFYSIAALRAEFGSVVVLMSFLGVFGIIISIFY
jgi:hypothetical protein